MKNQTSRYLKYAIGEILLVMIGILLALQVNNWNENRKLQKEELKLAKQLLEDAKADSIFFESRINFQKQRDTLLNDIANYSNNPTSDSIAQKAVNDTPFFFRLAYQSNLINNNPRAYDNISNDTIKNKLREYNAKYDYVVQSIELSNRITEEYGVPLEIKYHQNIKSLSETSIIKDFSFILDDSETLARLAKFKSFGLNYLKQVQTFLVTNQELIKLLENYINNTTK